MTLWIFYSLCTWWLSIKHFPCVHLWTFIDPTTATLAFGQNLDFIHHKNAMIWHLLLHLQPFGCPHGQPFASHLSILYSDAVTMLIYIQLLLSWLLVDSSLPAFLPTSEVYSENIAPKSGSLTSIWQNSFAFKRKGPIEWRCPRYNLIVSSTCRVQIEQLLWRLLIATIVKRIMEKNNWTV